MGPVGGTLAGTENVTNLVSHKAQLINRWRTAVWLTAGGVAVVGFGTLTVLTVATEGGLFAGSSVLAVGAAFLLSAGYEILALRNGERELRRLGIGWRAPRTLIPVARRDLHLPLSRAAALETAFQALQMAAPESRLHGVKRTPKRVQAYTPTPLLLWPDLEVRPAEGPPWWSGWWQSIRVTADEGPGGTDLHVVVHPLTQQWGEAIADEMVELIRHRLRVSG